MDLLKINRNNIIVFNLYKKENTHVFDFKSVIIPFDNFFVNTLIIHKTNEDIITVGGFLVTKFQDLLVVSFIWSRTKKDGFGFRCIFADENMVLSTNEKTNFQNEKNTNIDQEFIEPITKEIIARLSILFNKIIKKEYTSYKKLKNGNLIDKKIIYDNDVRTHMRHFWKDSGRFKIPLLKREEWERIGYKTHEIVVKDKEIRKNVPYKIINSFKIYGEEKKINREIDVIIKNNYKNEDKLGRILREIFPTEQIRHDKKFDKRSNTRLDYNLWDKKLAFEYDGEQHFDEELYKKLYGDGFKEQVKRDREKDKLCRKKGINLIRIKYNDPLNITYIKKRLKEMDIKW